MRVVHAASKGTEAFVARNLETGEEAVVVTTPYSADLFKKLPELWWDRLVAMHFPPVERFEV